MPQQRAAQRISEIPEIDLPNVRLCGSEAHGGVQQQSHKETPHDYEHTANRTSDINRTLRATGEISPLSSWSHHFRPADSASASVHRANSLDGVLLPMMCRQVGRPENHASKGLMGAKSHRKSLLYMPRRIGD